MSSTKDKELYHSPVEKEYYQLANQENFTKTVFKVPYNYNFKENQEKLQEYYGLIFGIGHDGNINISELPPHIESLHFLDNKFNGNLDNLALKNLTHLSFYRKAIFDKKLDYLPETLTHLELPENYFHNIDNLPQSLKYLMVYNEYNFDNLPFSLEKLIIKKPIIKKIVNIMCPNLKSLTLETSRCEIEHIPETLEYINITNYHRKSINSRLEYYPEYFPINLKFLSLDFFFFRELKHKIYRFDPFVIKDSHDTDITCYHTNLKMLILDKCKFDQVMKHEDLPFVKVDMKFTVFNYYDDADAEIIYFFQTSKW